MFCVHMVFGVLVSVRVAVLNTANGVCRQIHGYGALWCCHRGTLGLPSAIKDPAGDGVCF